MAFTTIDTKKLDIPKDVLRPHKVITMEELSGAQNEIVVIMQLGRTISYQAYVCHITNGDNGEGIYDLPGYIYVKVLPHTVREAEGVTFTMVCTAEKNDAYLCTNWLW